MRRLFASWISLLLFATAAGCPADDGGPPAFSWDICTGAGCADPGPTGQDGSVLPKDGAVAGDFSADDTGSKAPMGAPCQVNADCGSAYCHHPIGAAAYCSRECWGTCPEGFQCELHGPGRVCLLCEPDCTGRECGSDGCLGTCGTCATWDECDDVGHCQPVAHPFGGSCESSAHCESGICYAVGGSLVGFCSVLCSEGCPSGYKCGDYLTAEVCVPGCEPDCEGKTCGIDGCGGVCGKPCEFGYLCQQGACDWLPCAVTPPVGCCQGDTLNQCVGGALIQESCTDDPFCGWVDVLGRYACGTPPEADPSDQWPLECMNTSGLGNLDCEGWFGCSELCEAESWCLAACDAATLPAQFAVAQSLWDCSKQNTCGFDRLCLESHCPVDSAACFVD